MLMLVLGPEAVRPVAATVEVTLSGPLFVVRLFRGMFRGFYSFAAFCVSVALQLPSGSTTTAIAVAVALGVQAGVYWTTVPNNSPKPTPLRGAV